MINTMRTVLVGALALAGASLATAEAQAMPVQPLAPLAASTSSIEHVYYYGYRRPYYRFGYRRPFYGYGYRRFGYRPYYGFRRPFYGYRRPFYGYRRF